MQTITAEKLKVMLEKLIEADALEAVQDPSQSTRYYIPYMMSDCVEYYLILDMDPVRYTDRNASRLEEDLRIWMGGGSADFIRGDSESIAADRGFLSAFEAVITQIQESRNYYQYHRSGHYWVRGEEHLRRLVYQLGSIHEKMTYLGQEAVNEREIRLARLVEFGPLRYFSPINEDLDEWYINSSDGVDAMRQLAKDCRDERLEWLVASFGNLPAEELKSYLIDYLASDRGFVFCQELQKQVEEASRPYATRRFSNRLEAWAQQERRHIDGSLRKRGLIGRYPHYKSKDDRCYIIVTEEMPFEMRLLEDQNMAYRFYQQETILDVGHLRTKIDKLAEHR